MTLPSESCRECGLSFAEVPKKQGRNFCVECFTKRDRARRPEPAKRKEESRRHYERNRDKIAARNKAWNEAHREERLEYMRQWRREHTDRIRVRRTAQKPQSAAVRRRYRWVHKYGITVEQAEAMLRKQRGVCAICKQLNPDGRHLAVDHCHATGRVRGFLCTSCNIALGRFNDDPKLLRRAARYVTS